MATKTNTDINGKEYYRITRVIGHTYDNNGKKQAIKKQFYGTSRRNAELKYEEWKDAQKSGKQEDDAKTLKPLRELAEYYTDNILAVDSTLALQTRELYTSSFKNHLLGAPFMGKPVRALRPADIQDYYNGLDITKDSLRSAHNFMIRFFKWLSLNEYCPNHIQAITLPDKPKVKKSDEIVIWEESEINLIQEKLKDHRLYFAIILSLYAGLRISEILGLKYGDLKGNYIDVARQYSRGEFRPPKANSARSVPMHDVIATELERHKKWHTEEMKKNEYKTDYIFTTRNGYMLDYHNVVRSLERAYKANNIPLKKFHAYRATFCTRLCNSGVRIEIASKLMGHKSVVVTAKYYTHISSIEEMDAIKMI